MAYSQSQQMKKEFKLPLVPGMTCGEEMLRRNYHRAQIHGQTLDCVTKYGGVPADRTATNLQMTSSVGRYTTAAGTTNGVEDDGEDVDLTGCVLRFYGYTIEPVPESAQETERVRKVVLHYYLEDGTMSVTEPREDNSGISFPCNLKRHIVPSPDGTPITIDDIRIGEPLTFYGRTYLVYDADAFTRDFFQEAGSPLPSGLTPPEDQYTTTRRRPVAKAHDVPSIAATSGMTAVLTPEQVRATQQFLLFDRKVLRCDCTWDDSDSVCGYKHFLTLYYFLCDGSIALVEKDTPNSGRDPFPTFFRRQRIAKPTDPSGKFDSSSLGSVTFSENKGTVYYTDEDIRIGALLNLYGRKVLIHDYNQYTKEYLQEKFGISEYAPLPGATPPPFVPPGASRREMTQEELNTLHSHKTEDQRRLRYDGATVKFRMKLDNPSFSDAARSFVLTVYPADNTLSIFEPVSRNSGVVGGKSLQRQRVKRPDGGDFSTEDFYVGAHVRLNGFVFVLLSSDEHSLDYMEHNTEAFSRSDINQVVRKMQAMLQSTQTGLAEAFRQADEQHNSTGLDMSVLLNIMQQLKLDLSEQEILTVLRFFDKNNESYASYEEVAARVLPEGAAVASDDRPWQTIYSESIAQATQLFASDPNETARLQRQSAVTEAAARAAKLFLQLYEQRRQLFVKELRGVIDYARDSLIGTDEFKRYVRQKLALQEMSDEELNGLCEKLFPDAMPRLPFEEVLRLFNGTSSLPRNMAQIAAKQAQ